VTSETSTISNFVTWHNYREDLNVYQPCQNIRPVQCVVLCFGSVSSLWRCAVRASRTWIPHQLKVQFSVCTLRTVCMFAPFAVHSIPLRRHMSECRDTDPATALDVDSQNCSAYRWKSKGGYTLLTLPRVVTPYRDSVDGNRDRVTYQKLVTR